MKKLKSGIAYVSRIWKKMNTYTIPCGISENEIFIYKTKA
jgi:hypothetical protein